MSEEVAKKGLFGRFDRVTACGSRQQFLRGDKLARKHQGRFANSLHKAQSLLFGGVDPHSVFLDYDRIRLEARLKSLLILYPWEEKVFLRSGDE